MASGVRMSAFRILVVEDDDDLREMLAEELSLSGHAVWNARDGVETLALATERVFDCILLDIGLPRVSGLDVARRLRERGFQGAIVAVSGYARGEDREAARGAGVDAYLVKPVEIQSLQATMAACVQRAARRRHG